MKYAISLAIVLLIAGCSYEPSAEDKMLYDLQRVKIGERYPDTNLVVSRAVESNEKYTKYVIQYLSKDGPYFLYTYFTVDKNNRVLSIWSNQ